MGEEPRMQAAKIRSELGTSGSELRVRHHQESCGSLSQSDSVARFDEAVAILAGRPTSLARRFYWSDAQRNEGRCGIAPCRCWFRAKITYRFIHLVVSLGDGNVMVGWFRVTGLTDARGRPSASAPQAISERRPQEHVKAAVSSISWCFPQRQVKT